MRKKFDQELEAVKENLAKMGLLCEQEIEMAIEYIEKPDQKLETSIAETEQEIDDMERQIESQCLKLFMREQPVASDLRAVSAAMRMISDLERIGDHAEDIAEVAKYLNEDGSPAGSMNELREMSRAASAMVRNAVEAYAKKDLDLANQVAASDDVVDSYFEKIKRDIATQISENVESAQHGLDSLMVAKYLERIGDHSVNLAEWVRFMITGNKY
ncbi:MAG: phosphate signaling complex protein PhoU [Baileyella intestinalis]|uniref:phosphate signaling complex protein PhoU n=1 Tax=Baileyella intestinalis TaxID=2606709 RepID=UPI002A751F8F|nr:phosphate signaling complex protein PhoU [Baileyella intestinalis]MCI7686026.1 phosphate signaling complex protein PhoU [Clostridiales bacterium]MDY2994211.1 phosphate signaling complex protein PhoU [Baileyella intestinalis]